MYSAPKFFWDLDCDYYCGRILCGTYSDELKNRVREYITYFEALDKIGNPAIPYISAWRQEEQQIWYEFSGQKLKELVGCTTPEVADVFKKSIIGHTIYKYPGIQRGITKETLNCNELKNCRGKLRTDGINRGAVEAVYKVASVEGCTVWLKDLASVEIFKQDNICLSIGMLTDVTKEMKVEENLKLVEQELKRHRDHLEDIVRERTKKLWKAQLEVVSRLARAAEFRDRKTGSHITNMSRYCAVLSRAAGMGQAATAILYHAAPMHDVGKIGITDNILLKPGRLDQGEYENMKKHCVIGAKLLSGYDSNLLRVAKSIALTHHEKWDGSGYPNGLANSGIPFAGRIVAICDVFDALTSDRPYKTAWPIDKALMELRQQKGAHFDPKLIDLFFDNLPLVRKIHATMN